jgi:hypothetical protein
MKKTTYPLFAIILAIILPFTLGSCKNNPGNQEENNPDSLNFQTRQIADTVRFLWARCISDVTGDGILDLVFSENNAYGGILGYYEGKKEDGLWEMKIINNKLKDSLGFASGDLECADIDFDGDIDVVASRHPGEWKNANAEAHIFWYENPGWEEHFIGTVPDFAKDFNIADFDNDNKMDVAAITFEESSLTVYRQIEKDNWEKVFTKLSYKNIHEGMDVADLNADGYTDIVADGYVFYNPGGELKNAWKEENIDEIWNNQEGDWSRNATKVFARDINNDNKAEVFISHSERAGYPVSLYHKIENEWKKTIIADSLAAAHTLQVFDFDLDGDYDVFTGMNKGRAAGIGYEEFDVYIFLAGPHHEEWTPFLLDKKGVYNGEVADYDNDGDYDIFRYYSHDGDKFFLMENKLKD